jgi:hypothetical protein
MDAPIPNSINDLNFVSFQLAPNSTNFEQSSLRAKRSNPVLCTSALDCFVASLFAMTIQVERFSI